MADPKAEAAKARIISHMNADHQTSLSYYLRHYAQLSASQARKPSMLDISMDSMTLQTAAGEKHTIAINPPMASWADARLRAVDMDKEAREALGIDSIRITAYEPPTTPIHIFVFTACALTAILFILSSKIVPGTTFYDSVLPYFPGGPKVFVWLVKRLAFPVLLIHIAETYFLDKTRLTRYGVERGSALWWQWVASCFIEGFGCFQRIDWEVARKRKEAEGKAH
ncbi:hypothetical protein BP5796_06614 [Coleophoma crateriformis]|uniref:DUF2470 domain-containing protein n=1 Tax=Coleophoma crateriformis TaxID=565419 RepID=A0A3D8RP17_9HELO|nr:hypothetical protein BP5796_06614 [Coleophoma crateriformis]